MTNTPTTFFGWIIFLIQQYHGYYLQGLLTTLETSLAGTICGCFLGFLVGIIQATDICSAEWQTAYWLQFLPHC